MRDFSAFSGSAPSAIAAGSVTAKVRIFWNCEPVGVDTRLLDVVEKYSCASEGARNPFDIVARNATASVN